jgi:hypothetical protein
MHANAKHKSLRFRLVRLAVGHLLLELDGCGQCLDRAAELDKGAVAGQFDDSAVTAAQYGLQALAAHLAQTCVRACLVAAHQPRVRLAFVRLSRAIGLPASTTCLKDVPRSLRRTKSLLVPVSISSRRLAFFFAAALRLTAVFRFAAYFFAAIGPPPMLPDNESNREGFRR